MPTVSLYVRYYFTTVKGQNCKNNVCLCTYWPVKHHKQKEENETKEKYGHFEILILIKIQFNNETKIVLDEANQTQITMKLHPSVF